MRSSTISAGERRHGVERIAFVLVALVVAALLNVVPAAPAEAASGSQFQAGNIISDQKFYDSNALSEAQIQAFFQGIPCAPRNAVPCLKDFRQTTQTKVAQGAGHCARYDGAADESAARILWRVSQVCGISPAVLIVLMQKEQSLLTSPSGYGYERAMGWGCPDTAPCNADYFGYFNQVYKSAWQFRQYTLTPNSWRYRIGVNSIQWHPNASCGASEVRIVNQATANLYIYTPYQPNGAALANLYGTGDGCSSYGNRNFWRIYSDWFGSPMDPPGTPIGEVKDLWTEPNTISFWGWVFDPDTPTASIPVHVSVDGQWSVFTANADNATADTLYPGAGRAHGFGGTLNVVPGRHQICIYGVNAGAGANLSMRCSVVTVPDGSPIGEVKEIWGAVNAISLWGWAGDLDMQTATTEVQVRVDGTRWTVMKADQTYPGLENLLPKSPARHGFGGSIPVAPGPHEVCVFAKNQGKGSDSVLNCSTVSVVDGSPSGALKEVTAIPGGATLWGWAVDPDALTTPAPVHVRIDGTSWVVMQAGQAYAPATSVRGAGPNLGFGGTLPLSPGRHDICVFAANLGQGASTTLGCKTITVPGGSPVGVVNDMWTTPGAINFWGWTLDPDTAAAIDVHVLIDDRWAVVHADAANPGVAASFPAYGAGHGFGATLPVTPGVHRACLYGVNVGAGANLALGCWTLTVG